MLIIGVCGQTGAGKSTLAEMLSKHGFGDNLEVDAIGHELLLDPKVKTRLVGRFGEDILDAAGMICRRSLGRRAFVDSASTRALNEIMHPAMVEMVRDRIKTAEKAGQQSIIINAALLFSMGLAALCNELVYVKADATVRFCRLVELRGWTEASARERLFAQDEMPENERIIVVTNDGAESDLAAAAANLAADFATKLTGTDK
jgi:dephospho-CoA kinase